MAGVPVRIVLAALPAGVFAGGPAAASEKETQGEVTRRTEPTYRLARVSDSGAPADVNLDFGLRADTTPRDVCVAVDCAAPFEFRMAWTPRGFRHQSRTDASCRFTTLRPYRMDSTVPGHRRAASQPLTPIRRPTRRVSSQPRACSARGGGNDDFQVQPHRNLRRRAMKRLVFAVAISPAILCLPAVAGDRYSAGSMWGTDGSGVAVSGAAASSTAHVQNGTVAGQANAAEEGLLLATGSEGSITIQSIGSQTVVSSNISGNDNSIDTSASQSSENNGDVTNDGQVNTGDNATNNN